MNQNRFTSPVVWAAVAAQLLTILSTLGGDQRRTKRRSGRGGIRRAAAAHRLRGAEQPHQQRHFLTNRPRSTADGAFGCQKSGCGHFFEKKARRLRTAQIRLVALLPDGGFVRTFLAKGEKDPPRRQSHRIRLQSEGLRALRHLPGVI